MTSFRRATSDAVVGVRKAHPAHLVALVAIALTAVVVAIAGSPASAGTPGGGGKPGTSGGYASGGWGGCFFGTCSSTTNGGGGGGASTVQTCAPGAADCVASYYTAGEPRLVVAGGGGGAGAFDGCGGGSAGGGRQSATSSYCNSGSGGGGGNGTGGSGENVNCGVEGFAGTGATPAAPGAGGTGGGNQQAGTAGSGPVGGDGYVTTASSGGGGGGGGGYYGGGGGGSTSNCGAWGAGGGAGSSYSTAAMTVGNDTTGNPHITFTYGADSTTRTFAAGPEQTFVVPADVTALQVVAVGGTGGNNGENDGFGGKGAIVTTTISVTPGATLYVEVGSNGSNATVAPGAAATALSSITGSAAYAGPATLSATLKSAGTPLSGKTVTFVLGGVAAGSATTNASGVATLTGVSIGSNAPGTFTAAVGATFTGGGAYDGSTGSGDLTVTQAAQTLTFTSSAPSAATVGGTYTATATGGASGNTVTFSRDAATTNDACTVSATGAVTLDHTGTCVIDADQAGNADYTAAPTAQQQVAVGPAAQAVNVTSTAPSTAVVGDSYTATATGGASGNTVTFSRDVATTNDACTVTTNGAVTLDHAGTCVIDADQAGNADYTAAPTAQQQVDVAQAPQLVAFTSSSPATPAYGGKYTPTATGGQSGNAVAFTIDAATTNDACSIQAGTVTFHHAGTCVIDAGQAGNADYTAAPVVTQTIVVAPAAQLIGFTSAVPSDATVGGSYTPAATGGLSGQGVTFSTDPATTANACTITANTLTFDHAGTCVVDAAQAGNADYTAAPTATQTIPVGADATTTSVSVQPASISATVTAVNPTSADPVGVVDFSVDGTPVGSAPVAHGHAVLSYVVPADATRHVAAVYAGSADFTGSSASTNRTNPTIHAVVTSARPQTRSGWYSTPVTVSFVCDAGSAELSQPCPAPATLSGTSGGQAVGRSVLTDDGGAAVASVDGVNIDRTRPAVRVVGVRNGGVYRGAPVQPRCAGSDPESGIVACTLHSTMSRGGLVHYRATAVNAAGLTRTTTGTYRMLTIWVAGTRYANEDFQVRAGGTYVIYAVSNAQPRYEWAAPATTTHPADRPRGGRSAFAPVGPGLWRTTISITPAMMKRYRLWNLGVAIGATPNVLTVALHH